jgi:FkbM family methyltransferase
MAPPNWLISPLRTRHSPVLRGNGRGLRVKVGTSAQVLTGGNEPRIENALLAALNEGDVFYDVGGNIGWYSLLAYRKTKRPVVAFEPNVENAAILRGNARVNDTPITVVPAAVSDLDGWAAFQDRGSLEGRLEKADTPQQAARRAKRGEHHNGTMPVPVVTLDGWVAENPSPAMVKIDVEGGEVGVLRGMVGLLAANGPTLLIELHGTQSEVADFLDAHDYEHAPVETDVPTREAPWWVHVLARPKVRAT